MGQETALRTDDDHFDDHGDHLMIDRSHTTAKHWHLSMGAILAIVKNVANIVRVQRCIERVGFCRLILLVSPPRVRTAVALNDDVSFWCKKVTVVG